jgi:hypothetical protein
MSEQLALCSVVTQAVLDEFLLLKYSFELFHGTVYIWFIRCDEYSKGVLERFSNLRLTVFSVTTGDRPDMTSQAFRRIVSQKALALADAWTAGAWSAVAFIDADVLITAEILNAVTSAEGDVVLTPNFYPTASEHFAAVHGYFNAGFVCTRTPAFPEWWLKRIRSRPWLFTDQMALNDASDTFEVGTLEESANIGFWRSSGSRFLPIPDDCLFCHVHVFLPLRTAREWTCKMFAVHCLRFLSRSAVQQHRLLYDYILAHDRTGWYTATMLLL